MSKRSYAEKLKDPRWQKRRLEVLDRDEWCCQKCFGSEETLHVHHKYYQSCDPWDTPPDGLVTLCEECHGQETERWRELRPKMARVFGRLFFSDDAETILDTLDDVGEWHVSSVMADSIAWGIRNFRVLEAGLFEEYKSRKHG